MSTRTLAQSRNGFQHEVPSETTKQDGHTRTTPRRHQVQSCKNPTSYTTQSQQQLKTERAHPGATEHPEKAYSNRKHAAREACCVAAADMVHFSKPCANPDLMQHIFRETRCLEL